MMKGMDRKSRGSTSIFFSLILLLVLSLLFTLLEGTRVEGLKANVRMNSDLVTESILAEYVKPLWQKYHLLAENGGDEKGWLRIEGISQKARLLGEENLEWQDTGKRGLWMYPLHLQDIAVTEYHLITDDNGDGFYHLVTEYMSENLTKEGAEAIYKKIKKMQDTSEEAGDVSKKVEEAKTCVEEAAQEGNAKAEQSVQQQMTENRSSVTEKSEAWKEVENPLEYIGEWKSTALLTLLGADASRLSAKTADTSQILETRKKNVGNWKQDIPEGKWYERILFQEYLLKYFSAYPVGEAETVTKKDVQIESVGAESVGSNEKAGKLDYELEYLIAGKASDKQNLQQVLERILLLREAANFVYLQTDSQKKGEALTLATLLVGATGSGLLIKGVQQGILAVWAFAESVSDVKSLLAGEKIPVIKSAGEWSTDVGGLSGKSQFQKAETCKNGLGYEDYLRVLLFLTGRAKLNYRAMDLIEWELQSIEGYSNLRMDTLLDRCRIRYDYTAQPMFLSLGIEEYCWSIQRTGTYMRE